MKESITLEQIQNTITEIEDQIQLEINEIGSCRQANYEIFRANRRRRKEVETIQNKRLGFGEDEKKDNDRVSQLYMHIAECENRLDTNLLNINESELNLGKLYAQYKRYSLIEHAYLNNEVLRNETDYEDVLTEISDEDV
jgi:hypothetical protein